MYSRSTLALAALCSALALAGCGGGEGGDGGSAGGGTGGGGDGGGSTPTSKFTQSGSWTFTLPAAGGSVCYDFDTGVEVAACTGAAWDLKVSSGSRSATLWTNSGTSGTGQGGAFGGPFDHTWTELQTYQDATVDPASGSPLPAAVYTADSAASVFTGTNDIQSAAFEYDIAGDHRLYPNFRVFLITTDSTATVSGGSAPVTDGPNVFALQVTGYYGGAAGTTSGHPSFRWIARTSEAVPRTATVDATAGWVYYDLINGREVAESDSWHIAFNRYTFKLNGGTSGSGNVAGFVGKTPAGFYDIQGNPIKSQFTVTTNVSDTLPDLTASDMAVPTSTAGWIRDNLASALNPAARGFDFGWYTYNLSNHTLTANPEAGTLIRNGEGSSYTRLRLADIAYENPAVPTSPQTWTFDYDLQPAAD
ncbi:MAG: HmuY family protein [Pigmentiphaga sp.]|uniref:HmuY family protein n=1 Tax=Pigmentiphaga sp. TaxID=1977564 RepID=UPI0029BAF0E8|nr:HmuY family protein [Pigmentiphaga sp.]MDX3905948.1 HmuY family protein [Pigmentiphaga sp.]